MRKRTLTFAGCVIFGGGLLYIWARQPPGRPSAKIEFQNYSRDAESIVATIVLTNTGPSALAYVYGFGGALNSVSATTKAGATNYESFVRTATDTVVWPRDSARIRVHLPPETATWHCTVPVRGASSRVRIFTRLADSGVLNRAGKLSSCFIRLFPLNNTDSLQIQSGTFEILTNSSP